jgi:hypothetical protein
MRIEYGECLSWRDVCAQTGITARQLDHLCRTTPFPALGLTAPGAHVPDGSTSHGPGHHRLYRRELVPWLRTARALCDLFGGGLPAAFGLVLEHGRLVDGAVEIVLPVEGLVSGRLAVRC